MQEGVSLYGGYSAADWSRDLDKEENRAEIIDETSSTVTSHCIIKVSGGITSDTEINGLKITAGKGDEATGITVQPSLTTRSNTSITITNNLITSQTGNQNIYKLTGICLQSLKVDENYYSASAIIKNNYIKLISVDEGTGTNAIAMGIQFNNTGGNSDVEITGNSISIGLATGTTAYCRGILIDKNSTGRIKIQNNLIFAGYASSTSNPRIYGIFYDNSSVECKINNNTIYLANRLNPYTDTINTVMGITGILLYPGSNPVINNNIIIVEDVDKTDSTQIPIGEHLDVTYGSPLTVKNNNLHSLTRYNYIYKFDEDELSNFTAEITLSDSSTGTLKSFGNINENIIESDFFVDLNGTDGDPATFEDNNWRIKNIPDTVNLRYGGIDLYKIAKETNPDEKPHKDKDGKLRTTKNAGMASNSGAEGWSIGAYEID